jgi:transcription elongation factor GreA
MEMLTRGEIEGLRVRLNALIDNRPNITQRIKEARELGDLKENADYHAAKEEQGMQESEIQRLEKRLAQVQEVDDSHKDSGVVFIGTTVRIVEVRVDDNGNKRSEVGDSELFRLVGESSGAPAGEITEATVSSPFGEALFKARIGEVISVRGPRGIKRFEIKEIL